MINNTITSSLRKNTRWLTHFGGRTCASLLLIYSLLALSPTLDAKVVKGSVKSGDTALPGVIVSDGYRFTRTGADGKFSINTHRDARFVFVVTPGGYVADYSTGAPHFYLPVKGTRSFNFTLQEFGGGEDFTLFSVSDPQMSTKRHLNRFCGRPLGDLKGMSAKYSAQRPTVGIALGDIAWNRLEMFDSYKEAIATTGIPFYGVIGNHDFIQSESSIAAGAAYEAAFGPYNYAFFIGKDLVIGLNDILFEGNGTDDALKSSNNYKEGYSDEALGFVKGLLKYVGKDTHIFIAQHSPIGFGEKRIERADELIALLDGYKVDILSGHTHVMNKLKVTDAITDNNAAAIGGAWWATDWCRDGTPRGYEIISSIGGKLDFRWHNIDYPDDFQVDFIEYGDGFMHRNSILANAWAADDTWTCTWTQDGVDMGRIEEREKDYSPAYAAEILAAYKGEAEKIPGYKRPSATPHYYVATPSQYASKASMTVTAPDGRSWTHEFDLRNRFIDLQAHRGGAGLMPENTLSSMKNALDLNVNTLELDLQLSADGKVVVSHDNYFHPRYSMRPDSSLVQKEDPREYLYKMPFDSIYRYDVGLRPVEQWPGQQKVSEHKPLASDLIDFTEAYVAKKGLSPVRYNIEIKSRTGKGEGKNWPDYKEFCDKCIPLLLSKQLGDRLVVQSFDTRALEYIHEKYPQVELSYLTDSDEPEIEKILSQLSFTPRWWSPHYSVITHENVAYCHALGIRVVPWTVDRDEDILRMKDCRVDAIISNYPDRLINNLRKQ